MKILLKCAECRPLPTSMFIISNEGFISPEIDFGGNKMQAPVFGGGSYMCLLEGRVSRVSTGKNM